MNNVLISHNKHWENSYEGLYSRAVFSELLANLKVRHIQVLQGIRRCGKSSLFKILINHLMQKIDGKSILYLNLDDPFFIQYASTPEALYEVVLLAEKLTQTQIKYLFLDEVQAINGWEKYVKSVYDSEQFTKIFITGSNSSLLNGELATLLTGRYISTQIYPLSFQEILKINNLNSYLELNKQLPKVLKIVDDMMQYGSFVEVIDIPVDLKRKLITSYYETILLKDCVANAGIRDIKGFKELSFYLITNLTAPYSYSSLARATNVSDVSIKEYIFALESSYLFTELKQFSYSLKEQASNKKKLYLTDNSFAKLTYGFTGNNGRLFENLVFAELQKRGNEIFFYSKGHECDFIIKNEARLTALQVCYQLNEQNQAREINGLLKLPFEVTDRIIITYNQTMMLDNVRVLPFWEYFYFFKGLTQVVGLHYG